MLFMQLKHQSWALWRQALHLWSFTHTSNNCIMYSKHRKIKSNECLFDTANKLTEMALSPHIFPLSRGGKKKWLNEWRFINVVPRGGKSELRGILSQWTCVKVFLDQSIFKTATEVDILLPNLLRVLKLYYFWHSLWMPP